MEERKKAYEWVVTMNGGDFHVLSQKQYEVFLQNPDGGKINFDDFGFNPSYVSSWFKRPAEALLEKYPCQTCHATGHKFDGTRNITCPSCKGTGLSI